MLALEELMQQLAPYRAKLEEMGASLWRRQHARQDSPIGGNLGWPEILGRPGEFAETIAAD
jgi:hypothetical protein